MQCKNKLLNKNKYKNNFYKKIIIVLTCFLFQTIPYGVAINTQPIFVPFVSDILFGGDNYQFLFTLMFTIGSISSALISPIIGKKYGKINIKWLFLIGSFLSGGSIALQGLSQFVVPSKAKAATILYIFRITAQIGTTMFSSLGIPFLINAWFVGRGRGIALGIAFAGGSFGNIVIWQLLTNWLIQTHVLGNVLNIYFLYGGISILSAVTLSLLFVKLPGRVINKNQNQSNLIQYQTVEEEIEANGPGIHFVLRNPNFWVLSICYGIAGFGCCAFSSQYSAFIDALNATDILKLVGIGWGFGCLFGNVLGGLIFEHLGINNGIRFANIVRIIATIFVLLGAINPYFVVLAAIFFGFSVFMYTSGSSFMTYSLFGKKDALVTMSIISLCFSIGFAIGQPSMSLIKSSSEFSYAFGAKMNGNWLWMWVISLIVSLIGFCFMTFAITKLKKIGYNGIKEYKNNKANFLMSFKKINIFLTSFNIWKNQKDSRLSAKTYLKTLKEKNFNNNEEIKTKQLKNKEYYFEKLEKLALSHTKLIKKIENKILNLSNTKSSNYEEKIKKLNTKLFNINNNYTINKNNLIYAYHKMNYYIQFKPFMYNQEIDKTITRIKDNKTNKFNKKTLLIEKTIKKLNDKLNKLVHPEPKIVKGKDGSNITLERAPIDLNKPTKKALNIINSINVYESKKQKIISYKLNIEHHFDLIKQQWNRNNFHKLITNPYYKTY